MTCIYKIIHKKGNFRLREGFRICQNNELKQKNRKIAMKSFCVIPVLLTLQKIVSKYLLSSLRVNKNDYFRNMSPIFI